MRWPYLIVALGCVACRAAPRGRMDHELPSPLAADAVAGVTAPALRALLAEHWEWSLWWAPVWATTLGDHRYDDRLAPEDAASIERMERERRELLAKARAVDPATIGADDAVTLALFVEQLEGEVGMDVCRFEQWSVSTGGGGALGTFTDLVESHGLATPADGDHLVTRMRLGAAQLDDRVANLRRGLAAGRVASAESVRRAIAQLGGALAQPIGEWAMAEPALDANEDTKAWPAPDRARFAKALVAVIEGEIRPRLIEVRRLLADEILPRARVEREGLVGLPDGPACYAAAIRAHLGLVRTPDDLHALGLREIARTDRELAELGARALGTADLASTIARLRGDRALYFASGDEIVATATRALDRARAAIPAAFGVLPRADCVVRVIPEHEAPYSTIAYYMDPHYDGSKPGEYFVNTFEPETRPRYEFEALSWHEAIPGHHLQVAIAQELGALPAFRKLTGTTAYVEGWALYTERLADEMGLYSSELDRVGMASYDAWRASRLVVDTGLHALGWTRRQAEVYMLAHTALSPENIANEVDRYIRNPGQALAYKVGQLEIVALRAEAQAALGAAFDLRAFHDVVLGGGAVTLPVLRARVERWIADRR